jgi:hypothetical protein
MLTLVCAGTENVPGLTARHIIEIAGSKAIPRSQESHLLF